MFQIQCLETHAKNPTSLSAKFCIDSLQQGQGITLGNALRRTLLSSVPGTAITGARIAGVSHEFSTIPNVKEDVIEILLNIKQVVLKGVVNEPALGRLDFCGPGIITVGDIKSNPQIKVIEPTQYIATVEAHTNLEIEFLIESGYGYSLSENKNKSSQIKDFLAIDAAFMPVRKVNFFIETAQVSGDKKTENLIFEVETNGSITPVEATSQALEILSTLFNSLNFQNDNPEVVTAPIVQESESNGTKLDLQNTQIEELELSVRAYNCLKRANIQTIGELINYSKEELLEFKNFGQKSADEVCESLSRRFNTNLK